MPPGNWAITCDIDAEKLEPDPPNGYGIPRGMALHFCLFVRSLLINYLARIYEQVEETLQDFGFTRSHGQTFIHRNGCSAFDARQAMQFLFTIQPTGVLEATVRYLELSYIHTLDMTSLFQSNLGEIQFAVIPTEFIGVDS